MKTKIIQINSRLKKVISDLVSVSYETVDNRAPLEADCLVSSGQEEIHASTLRVKSLFGNSR